MPQRHYDLGVCTYDERKKVGYGTAKERPFISCCICAQPVIEPLSCNEGHLFCKECIFECLLAQKKSLKRKLASFLNQEKCDGDQELEKRGAEDGGAGHGANHVRMSSYEDEALRTMKAFWLPSTASPEAVERVHTPSFDTCCPEGNEKLKLKDLFQLVFIDREETPRDEYHQFMCPSCSVTLTNALTLAALSTCGHVFCKACADQVVATSKECFACNKPCKAKHLVTLGRGMPRFFGGDT